MPNVQTLPYGVEEGIATVMLNRPDRMNTFTHRMMGELLAAFDETDADRCTVMDNQTTNEEFNPKFWPWGTAAECSRFLHTMIRVRDVDATLRFYVDGLGMKLLDRYDFESGRFSLLYLAFDGYEGGGALELTYNWDVKEAYSHGSGYGHIALGVPNIQDAVKRLEAIGAQIPVQPKKMAPGAPRIAFAKDPDGYQIELIQTRRA